MIAVTPVQRAVRWGGLLRERVHERAFWVIQVGVLVVTALHVGIELSDLQHETQLGGLPYLPMVLHLVPVAYAGYVYGYEGSILTGLWSGVLAVPNVMLWHTEDYGWLTDLVFTVFVIVLGVVVAVPVERERRERRRAERATARAEDANRRVTVLHDLATALVASASPHPLRQALDRLVAATHLRAVAIVERDAAGARHAVASSGDPTTHTRTDAEGEVEEISLALEADPPAVLEAEAQPGRAIHPADRELLTAAASQFTVAVDNTRLHDLDRQRMRTYVQEVTRAQERERARIARDLHDVVAQDLVVLTRRLEDTTASATATGDEDLLAARELAAASLKRLRSFSRDLRPTILDDLGLVPALQWLVDDFGEHHDARAHLAHTGPLPRLDAETELALFRVTQEALRNAARHGHAARADVSLTVTDDRVHLAIEDDGDGFDVPEPLDALAHRGSLGLLGMRERIELVGGVLRVTARRGTGTRVTATIEP